MIEQEWRCARGSKDKDTFNGIMVGTAGLAERL